MAHSSSIQWTQATWNPWHGCKKVSPGCKYCYMYRDKEKYGQDPMLVQRSKTRFNDPLKWTEGRVIFTCSWSDFFIEEADAWRRDAWEIIFATQRHFYQIVTKRPERIEMALPLDPGGFLGDREVPKNTIFIVSAEDQKTFDKRWPIMRELKREYGIKVGLSLEPLLGPIDLHDALVENWDCQPDWIIVGGESGNDIGKYLYRECKLQWIDEIVFLCQQLAVPVFVKQLGTFIATQLDLSDRHGGNIDEWPENNYWIDIKYREMPDFINMKADV
jgi:protein gp37